VPFTVLRPENFCAVATSISSFSDEILSSYKYDEFYCNICNYLDNPKSPIPHPQIDKFTISNSFLLFNNKIYIPPKCRSFILKICHDSPAAGHFGIKKTSSLISRDFSWPSLNSDVADIMFVLAKLALVQSLLVISLMDSLNLLPLLIVLGHLFQWIILRISLHLMGSHVFLLLLID